MRRTLQQTCSLFNFRIPCRHGISHSEMRAHIFLQRPAAAPLESACLAVVTHRQTLVFCASFPGGDFFWGMPEATPRHARQHVRIRGVGDIRGLPKWPTRWRCRPWYLFGQRDKRPAPLTAPKRSCGDTLRHAVQDIPLERAGHSPNPGQPAQPARKGAGPWAVRRPRPAAGRRSDRAPSPPAAKR